MSAVLNDDTRRPTRWKRRTMLAGLVLAVQAPIAWQILSRRSRPSLVLELHGPFPVKKLYSAEEVDEDSFVQPRKIVLEEFAGMNVLRVEFVLGAGHEPGLPLMLTAHLFDPVGITIQKIQRACNDQRAAHQAQDKPRKHIEVFQLEPGVVARTSRLSIELQALG